MKVPALRLLIPAILFVDGVENMFPASVPKGGWRPIKIAPKDEIIDLYYKGWMRFTDCFWCNFTEVLRGRKEKWTERE